MYIGNNRKPGEGEEKLHLVIEGRSELDVQAGKKEIQRCVAKKLSAFCSHRRRSGGGGYS